MLTVEGWFHDGEIDIPPDLCRHEPCRVLVTFLEGEQEDGDDSRLLAFLEETDPISDEQAEAMMQAYASRNDFFRRGS